MKFALVMLLLSGSAAYAAEPEPVLHRFGAWGSITEKDPNYASLLKPWIYFGWTNGFLQGRQPSEAAHYMELHDCLERMGVEQAVAMIDKYYKDHPEKWDRALGVQMLEALTVAAGPCEGKNPFKRGSK